MKRIKNSERGEVSLFVVVFAALLLTIVTVSFVRIMIHDQQQASTIDLSQSAYDSAQAGVEDAKLALLRCNNGGDCSALNSLTCNEAVGSSGEEVKLEDSESTSLNQAYTCLLINTQTDDVKGSLGKDGSDLIPLIGLSTFNTIKVEWFSTRDLSDANSLYATNLLASIPNFSDGTPLLGQTTWSAFRPSIMRAQLIQFNSGTGFSLSDFDNGASPNASNNVLFLYPTNISTDNTKSFTSDVRKSEKVTSIPQVKCNNLGATQNYACSATITLPQKVSGNDFPAYLRLTSLYKSSDYRITMQNIDNGITTQVKFNGVLPSIDSTGRASDMFRRVQARVRLTNTAFPYPEAEVDITGSLCKNFEVTNADTGYNLLSPTCTP